MLLLVDIKKNKGIKAYKMKRKLCNIRQKMTGGGRNSEEMCGQQIKHKKIDRILMKNHKTGTGREIYIALQFI